MRLLHPRNMWSSELRTQISLAFTPVWRERAEQTIHSAKVPSSSEKPGRQRWTSSHCVVESVFSQPGATQTKYKTSRVCWTKCSLSAKDKVLVPNHWRAKEIKLLQWYSQMLMEISLNFEDVLLGHVAIMFSFLLLSLTWDFQEKLIKLVRHSGKCVNLSINLNLMM